VRRKNAGLSVLGLLLAIAVIAIVVNAFFITVYRVPQNGMFPTIPGGDTFFARRRPYSSAGDVQRGDVVVFDHTHGGQAYRFVWRVIGVPGDIVSMEGTAVWINGQRLPHNLVSETNDSVIFQERNGGSDYTVAYDRHSSHPALPLRVKVANDCFFVLGDNRHDALDSTYLGAIPFDEIVARKLN
jgi:signal peptidase I